IPVLKGFAKTPIIHQKNSLHPHPSSPPSRSLERAISICSLSKGLPIPNTTALHTHTHTHTHYRHTYAEALLSRTQVTYRTDHQSNRGCVCVCVCVRARAREKECVCV